MTHVRPTLPKRSVYKIKAKNKARSSVLRDTNPRNRFPLQNTQRTRSAAAAS